MSDDPEYDFPMTEAEYELAWPKITRRLQRLCNEFGAWTVLSVFSNDMPHHREEREKEEQLARERRKQRRAVHCHTASVH